MDEHLPQTQHTPRSISPPLIADLASALDMALFPHGMTPFVSRHDGIKRLPDLRVALVEVAPNAI